MNLVPEESTSAMDANPICPECNLRRSLREFASIEGRYVNCAKCRSQGKSAKKVKPDDEAV